MVRNLNDFKHILYPAASNFFNAAYDYEDFYCKNGNLNGMHHFWENSTYNSVSYKTKLTLLKTIIQKITAFESSVIHLLGPYYSYIHTLSLTYCIQLL